MKKDTFKRGFTLAEVLIVIGVIGVVAALTIPGLIKAYNKKVYATRLEKAYSVLSQAVKTVADNGGIEFITDRISPTVSVIRPSLTVFIDELKKTTKLSELNDVIYKSKALGGYELDTIDCNSVNNNCFITSDSLFLNIRYGGIGDFEIHFDVDTNGINQPNILGRDLWYFEVIETPNGEYLIAATGGEQYLKNLKLRYGYNDTIINEMKNELGSCNPKNTEDTGATCFDRIVRDGWQMKY